MLTLDYQSILDLFQTNWGWATGLAASMLALTALAGKLLNPDRKEEIAFWLMGAQSEENWSRSFVSLFDSVFGERHLSLACFIRSAIASLVAVVVIWVLMGGFGSLELRAKSEMTLGGILVLALAVNVLADYASLLETRLLLGWMRNVRSGLAQLLVLVVDLVISALIIWLAIVAYLASPLHEGEVESFAEILGLFSIFSVLFYSTFLTSVWSWAYILSTWVMRLFIRLRLAHWLNVAEKPLLVLGNITALIVFLGALAVSIPMQKGADGLTVVDKTLCSVFKGRVCLDVAELTVAEQAQLDLIVLACEGGLTKECTDRALDTYEVKPRQAVRLWKVACNGGDMRGCTNLGYLYEKGIGVDQDPVEAIRLYRQGCDGGDANGCTNLGYLYHYGIGVDNDPVEAHRLYRQGCDGGHASGCTNLGYLYASGIGVDKDPVEPHRLYRQGCDGGDANGCTNLGYLYRNGIGVDKDLSEANRLYRQGCDGGNARGCTNLGINYEEGIGVDKDPVEANRLYRQGCDGGNARGCTNLGYLYDEGIGVDKDPVEANRLYRQGCEGGNAIGCTNLGVSYRHGIGVDKDPVEANRLYRQGCEGGDARGCTNLGYLYDEGIGVDKDPVEANRLYRQGCEGGNALGCTNLGYLYDKGIGVDRDPVEANRLYRQGCEGGNAIGCTNLGYLYDEGIGVDKDLIEAARFYRLGCELGRQKACEWADDLEQQQ